MTGVLLLCTLLTVCAEEPAAYVNISDHMDEFGNVLEERFLDEAGQLVLNECGYAIERSEYDELDQQTRVYYLDAEEQPVLNEEAGYAAADFAYDGDSNVVLEHYYDTDGRRMEMPGGYSGRALAYSPEKNVTEETFLNDADEPTVNLEKGYATIRHSYDESGNENATTYYDEKGGRTEVDGVFCIQRLFDLSGNVTDEMRFDAQEQVVLNPKGYAWVERTYDKNNKAVMETFVDADGFPVMVGEYAQVRREYDAQKRVIREAYYDADGDPVFLKKGYQAVLMEYGTGKKPVKKTYLDYDGTPVEIAAGYSVVTDAYDEAGNPVLEKWYDLEGKPVCPAENESYVAVRKEFSASGKPVRTVYLDAEDRPVNLNAGYAAVVNAYDERGNAIYEAYYNAQDQPVFVEKKGCAVIERTFNDKKKVTSEAYFNVDGSPASTKDGYVKKTMAYDEDGRLIRQAFLNAEGQPVNCRAGYAFLTKEYLEPEETDTDGMAGELIVSVGETSQTDSALMQPEEDALEKENLLTDETEADFSDEEETETEEVSSTDETEAEIPEEEMKEEEMPEQETEQPPEEEVEKIRTVRTRYYIADGNPASIAKKNYSMMEQYFNEDNKQVGEAYFDPDRNPVAIVTKKYSYVRFELIYLEDGSKEKIFYDAYGQIVHRG